MKFRFSSELSIQLLKYVLNNSTKGSSRNPDAAALIQLYLDQKKSCASARRGACDIQIPGITLGYLSPPLLIFLKA